MNDQTAPCRTLTFQSYHSEHIIFIFPLPLSEHKYTFITSLCEISIKFLPPTQSTSLPICNNVFHSFSSKKQSHTGGTTFCRAVLPTAAPFLKCLGLLQYQHNGQTVSLTWKEGNCRKPLGLPGRSKPSLSSRNIVKSSSPQKINLSPDRGSAKASPSKIALTLSESKGRQKKISMPTQLRAGRQCWVHRSWHSYTAQNRRLSFRERLLCHKSTPPPPLYVPAQTSLKPSANYKLTVPLANLP